MAHLRGHIDDDPAAIGDHQPRRGLRDDKRRSDVEPEQQVEGRLVDFEKGLRPVEAGIVDEDVEPRRGRRKASRTTSERVTSKGSGRALPPPQAISRATSSSSLGVRLTSTSSAPAAASASATARPMPRPAPVTSAILPSSRNALSADFAGIGFQ